MMAKQERNISDQKSRINPCDEMIIRHKEKKCETDKKKKAYLTT